jgi:hypothetical protein
VTPPPFPSPSAPFSETGQWDCSTCGMFGTPHTHTQHAPATMQRTQPRSCGRTHAETNILSQATSLRVHFAAAAVRLSTLELLGRSERSRPEVRTFCTPASLLLNSSDLLFRFYRCFGNKTGDLSVKVGDVVRGVLVRCTAHHVYFNLDNGAEGTTAPPYPPPLPCNEAAPSAHVRSLLCAQPKRPRARSRSQCSRALR